MSDQHENAGPIPPTYSAGFVSRQSSVTCRHAYVFEMNTS